MSRPRTVEELRKTNEIDPEFEAHIRNYPLPSSFGTSFPTIRHNRNLHLASLQRFLPIPGPLPNVKEHDIQVPTRDGAKVTCRVYVPDGNGDGLVKGGRPLFVAYHEGGWTLGGLEDEEMDCRMFAREFGGVAVNVEYRLAPEHPFPTFINDAWDVLQYLATHATTLLDADPTQGFLVGGASAGGNISAILTHLARDANLTPPLTGQFLSVPAVMPGVSVPEKWKAEYLSWDENVQDPVLKNEGATTGKPREPYEEIRQNLGLQDVKDPLWNATEAVGGHEGLPRAYLQVAGMDPLRDEGLLYERLLRESGVETRLDLYAGFGHMFWMNFPRMKASERRWKDTIDGFRWLLEKS